MGKGVKISETEREKIMLFLVVVLSFFRFSYFGFSYTPYLDDYTQYLYYPSFEDPWNNILVKGAGVLSTRPLAGLFDFFIWSRFYQNLGIAVAIISVLYGMSGVLFYKALKNLGIKVGSIFFAVYLFLPLNVEGSYWISASSRIVVSMFLISAAVWAATEDKTILFLLFNFLSVWFYEQTAVLSFFTGALAGFLKKSPRISVVSLVTFLSMIVFYFKFGTLGENADRLKVIDPGGTIENGVNIVSALASIMGRVNISIIFNGFIRGFKIIALDFSFIWLGLLTIFCIFFINFSYDKKPKSKTQKKQLLMGAVLALIPLLPFFIVKNSAMNLRNIVPCLLGFGVMADGVSDRIFKEYTPIVAAVLIFCFSISAVAEVNDYNYIAKQDAKTAEEIAKMVGPDTKRIKVRLDVPKYYSQNAPYNDHIISFTQSDWGPTGIVRTLSKNRWIVVEVIIE